MIHMAPRRRTRSAVSIAPFVSVCRLRCDLAILTFKWVEKFRFDDIPFVRLGKTRQPRLFENPHLRIEVEGFDNGSGVEICKTT